MATSLPTPPIDASPASEVHVWYNDGTGVRHKRLTFLKSEEGLVYFYNAEQDIQEILPLTGIVRMAGVKPGE